METTPPPSPITAPEPSSKPTGKRLAIYGALTFFTLGFAAPLVAWHWSGRKFTVAPVIGLVVAGFVCFGIIASVLPGEETGKGKTTKAAAASSKSDASEAKANQDEAAEEAAAEAKASAEVEAKAAADAKAKAVAAAKAKRVAALKAKRAAALKAKREREAAAARQAAAASAAQTDPQFGTCGEANDAGYGDYSSSDPEYGWYDDRDGDGTVCER